MTHKLKHLSWCKLLFPTFSITHCHSHSNLNYINLVEHEHVWQPNESALVHSILILSFFPPSGVISRLFHVFVFFSCVWTISFFMRRIAPDSYCFSSSSLFMVYFPNACFPIKRPTKKVRHIFISYLPLVLILFFVAHIWHVCARARHSTHLSVNLYLFE